MSESLYFIAIVPPKEIQDDITGFKKEIAERFGSKHALNSPPHITLHMPFRWKDKKADQLDALMRRLNDDLQPFEVQLKDFDFFEPRVVFVDVVENEPLERLQGTLFTACRRQLKLDNANYKNRGFHPHVTIGFRDLRKRMFYAAKEEFEQREFAAEFLVDRIELLRHDGSKWSLVSI